MGASSSSPLKQLKSGKSDELALSHHRLDHLCRAMYIPTAKKWSLCNNYISSIDPIVCTFKALTHVDLSANDISSFPVELCGVASIQYLNMSFNHIEALPEDIRKLSSLIKLNISFNYIQRLHEGFGEGLISLQRMEASNNFMDDLPISFRSMQSLKVLNLQNNNFTIFPGTLCTMSSLEDLNLSHNKLSDIPPSIGALERLRTLSLNANALTSFPPTPLYPPSLPALKFLRLHNNKIHTLTPDFSLLTALQSLNMGGNDMQALPPELLLLTNMKRMNFAMNPRFDMDHPSLAEYMACRTLVLPSPKPHGEEDNKAQALSTTDKKKKIKKEKKDKSNNNKKKRNEKSSSSSSSSSNSSSSSSNSMLTKSDSDSSISSSRGRGGSHSNRAEAVPNAVEMYISRGMVPKQEGQAQSRVQPEHYKGLQILDDEYEIDQGYFEVHAESLFNQCVWSGGYNVASVLEEVKKTLVSITEIRPGLYLTSKYGAANKQELQIRGITHVLVVAHELEPAYPDEFEYCTINVRDNCMLNDLTVYFPLCHKFIDIGRRKGAVLVHCAAGVSRSASVVISYLMKTEQMSFVNAKKEVTRLRPIVKPNFYLQLQGFSEFLSGYRKKVAKREMNQARAKTPPPKLTSSNVSVSTQRMSFSKSTSLPSITTTENKGVLSGYTVDASGGGGSSSGDRKSLGRTLSLANFFSKRRI